MLTDAQRALADTQVLRLLVTGLFGMLRASNTASAEAVGRIIDAALERVEEQHADPHGPGAEAVDYMREQLEFLLATTGHPPR